MDRDALRAVQAPLKARYRGDPNAGVITLHAQGDLGEGITCSVDTGRALAQAGLHPSTGGDASNVCSGDMLLQALVACAGVTLRAVAIAKGLDVSGSVKADGDLDVRGTLGIDRDAPVGFREIRLRFDLKSSATAEELDSLVSTTERYCVVLQTLVATPGLAVTHS